MEKTNETPRTMSLVWWKKLKSNIRLYYWREYQKNTFTPSHSPDELTGREIEEIWRKETKDGSDREIIEYAFPDLKSNPLDALPDELINVDFDGIEEEHNINHNQKEYKRFDESLFKAYINKFKLEDKVKAYEILLKEVAKQKYNI